MIYVYKQPNTAAEAQIELDKLAKEATIVMMPDNFKRLSQRRNKLNARYDQLQLFANLEANKGDAEWEAIATRVGRDKEILIAVKQEIQATGVQLY